jgi:hypothetical protein
MFPMLRIFLIAVCMTVVDSEHDIQIYNAEENANAFASSLELQVICSDSEACSGEPLRCTLFTSYSIESPMCWDRNGDIGCMEQHFVDVPVATIECSNVISCSPFTTPGDPDLKFDYILDPGDCCQVIR